MIKMDLKRTGNEVDWGTGSLPDSDIKINLWVIGWQRRINNLGKVF